MELEAIRKQIDTIDSMIISLLAKRSGLVSAAGKLKKNEQGVRDPKRVEQVIEKVRAKAADAGLDQGIAEEIYRTIIGCFVGKELKEFAAGEAGQAKPEGIGDRFPEFIRDRANAVASGHRSDGVEGYVFDGVNGSQVVLFECEKDGVSKEHLHPFDEYFAVLRGEYTLGIRGREIRLQAGQEYYIPQGIPHGGRFTAGTRTINAFGGRRAERLKEDAVK